MQRRMAVCAALLALAAGARAQDDRNERVSDLLRRGQYADARRLIDEILRTETRGDLRNVREVFPSSPNMRVRKAAATFTCDVAGGVRLPLTVNGMQVDWLLDTGAGASIISDAEARRLGLELRDEGGRASDLAGGSTAVRTAVAPRVVVGRTELHDVTFLVTPAENMPWKELPPGKQGIAGLPIALAFDALRWTRAGECHTGSAAVQSSPAGTPPNLRYDHLYLVADVAVEGKSLEFLLDSGNQAGTQLWERFGKDFEALVKERGRPDSVRVTQFGGSADRDVTRIGVVRLKVGGKDVALAEGTVFARPVGDARFHGLLGMDVLNQADEVTIDFRAMMLTLR